MVQWNQQNAQIMQRKDLKLSKYKQKPGHDWGIKDYPTKSYQIVMKSPVGPPQPRRPLSLFVGHLRRHQQPADLVSGANYPPTHSAFAPWFASGQLMKENFSVCILNEGKFVHLHVQLLSHITLTLYICIAISRPITPLPLQVNVGSCCTSSLSSIAAAAVGDSCP